VPAFPATLAASGQLVATPPWIRHPNCLGVKEKRDARQLTLLCRQIGLNKEVNGPYVRADSSPKRNHGNMSDAGRRL
ncbi:MAG: hypothetical protein Q8M72_06815, partial [Methylocystis sp.]|nr:hypothetical protein [Methylocystis sp.]